jgi:hypothetical protein
MLKKLLATFASINDWIKDIDPKEPFSALQEDTAV